MGVPAPGTSSAIVPRAHQTYSAEKSTVRNIIGYDP